MKQFSSNLRVFVAEVLAVCVIIFCLRRIGCFALQAHFQENWWLYSFCEILNIVLVSILGLPPPLNTHDTYQKFLNFFVCQPIVAFLYQPWSYVLATNGTLCVKSGNLLLAVLAQKMRTSAWCVRKQRTCSFLLSQAFIAYRAFCGSSLHEFLVFL